MVVNVKDVPEANQYEARVEGESKVAGVAPYIRTTELIAFGAAYTASCLCPLGEGRIHCREA